MYFRYFVIISPWEKDGPFFLTNLKNPSPKDALGQVWLKLAQWFQNRRFLNFVNVFSLFRNYLPLEKYRALHLNKLQSPLSKDALCQVWLKLAQRFWRRRWKCEKFTDGRTDRQTDRQTTEDRWSEKLNWAFSSGELKRINLIFSVKGWFLSNNFINSLRQIKTWSESSPPGFQVSLLLTLFLKKLLMLHEHVAQASISQSTFKIYSLTNFPNTHYFSYQLSF